MSALEPGGAPPGASGANRAPNVARSRQPFGFKPGSKFLQPSVVQQQALRSIREVMALEQPGAGRESGFFVLPCGSGKTYLMVMAAIEAVLQRHDGKARALFLCYEQQAVLQLEALLKEDTTLSPRDYCVYTGAQKDRDNVRARFFITTYSMFAGAPPKDAKHGEVYDMVRETAWGLVLCDEAHHVGAHTYEPLVRKLLQHSLQLFGFTATLYRSYEERSTETRAAHETRVFGWLGPVHFRRTIRDLEALGLIAKVRQVVVEVPFVPVFDAAYEASANDPSLRTRLQGVHPTKLNALVQICETHRLLGHGGIVFATHLYAAQVLQTTLDGRVGKWRILAGSNAHGEQAVRTARTNAELVRQFNAGRLDGLISTSVGESALDAFCSKYRYSVVVDSHSGDASTLQKQGRLSRTVHVTLQGGESEAQLRQRQLDSQLHKSYYELVTPKTGEHEACEKRKRHYKKEGLPKSKPLALGRVMSNAAHLGTELPYNNNFDCLKLLKSTLMYDEVGKSDARGKARATEMRAAHRSTVQQLAQRASGTRNHHFKERRLAELAKAKRHTVRVQTEAKQARQEKLGETRLPPHWLAFFESCGLSAAHRAALCLGPSAE
jgi:superfamily II DNA or RNA helicase